MEKKCDICKGKGWVCENHDENHDKNHDEKLWSEGDLCCGGAGAHCKCNKMSLPRCYAELWRIFYMQSYGEYSIGIGETFEIDIEKTKNVMLKFLTFPIFPKGENI